MKNALFPLAFLFCALLIGPVEKFARNKMTVERLHEPPTEKMADLAVLEFKNLANDVLFFDAVTFVGGKRTRLISAQEWEWLYLTLNLSSSLNPINKDPYYLGEAVLTWDARMYDRANTLLQRAVQYKDKEWVFPFYIGFNYFYFMDNPGKGAEYLKIAIEKPQSPVTILTTLASRLYYRSGRTEVGIALLKDSARHATQESEKITYEMRIKALEGVNSIEKAIEQYKSRYAKEPRNVEALVRAGFIKELPVDPYKGKYYIDVKGNVKSTSNFR